MPDGSLPARTGVGLKSQHHQQVVDEWPDIGWFEVHAENYFVAGGPAHHYLQRVRDRYPLSVHGVGLSLGSAGALDLEHLQRLDAVIGRYRPAVVSEHLAWSYRNGEYLHDLLPLPYTVEALHRVAGHVDQVQQFLGRQLLVENPSRYLELHGEMTEAEFLQALVARTGCGLLLDVNNAYVSAVNHGGSARSFVAALPAASIGEIHLSGHAVSRDSDGRRLLIDDHGGPVAADVWRLYRWTIDRIGRRPTLIEWDNDVPEWEILHEQAAVADRILAEHASPCCP